MTESTLCRLFLYTLLATSWLPGCSGQAFEAGSSSRGGSGGGGGGGAGAGAMAGTSVNGGAAGSRITPPPPMETGGQTTGTPLGGSAAAEPFGLGGGAAAGGDPAGNSAGADMEGGAAGEASGGAGGAAPGDDLDLIDDMEAVFPNLPPRQGRDGAWFSAHDDTNGHALGPTALALIPSRGSSHVAAGISGAAFTDWGAQLGLSLRASGASFDASRYCGLHFWARGGGAGWTLLVSDHSSMPQGGVCDPVNLKGAAGCYHFVGSGFAVSQDWREVTLGFDQLRLVADPTSARRLETNEIYSIIFNFHSATGSAFHLAVDDISFIRAGSEICPPGPA